MVNIIFSGLLAMIIIKIVRSASKAYFPISLDRAKD
jgi:hypothetical protein